MNRTMFDSTTVADVPSGGDLYLGYPDGNYRTVDGLHERFPRSRVVVTTVNGSTKGCNLVDCETGDTVPETAVGYVKGEIKGGNDHPGVYTYVSSLAAVCHQVLAQGVNPASVLFMTAHYTGKPHLCDAKCYGQLPFEPRIIATQYAAPGYGSRGHYDVSLVAPFWPGVDPKPQPAPKPWFHRTLRRGSVGRDVVALKRRLRAHGYHGFVVPSPMFGRGCEKAVRAFQSAHHLVVDGVVGAKTAKALG